jgi:hypothetical protein
MPRHRTLYSTFPPPDLNARLESVSPQGRVMVDALLNRWREETRIALSRVECQRFGGWKLSTQIKKEVSGLLPSYLDGTSRRILAVTLFGHLFDLICDSNPVAAKPPTVRLPPGRYQKRPRTQAELDGLAKANAERHAEAVARREARARRAASA